MLLELKGRLIMSIRVPPRTSVVDFARGRGRPRRKRSTRRSSGPPSSSSRHPHYTTEPNVAVRLQPRSALLDLPLRDLHQGRYGRHAGAGDDWYDNEWGFIRMATPPSPWASSLERNSVVHRRANPAARWVTTSVSGPAGIGGAVCADGRWCRSANDRSRGLRGAAAGRRNEGLQGP